MSNTPVQELSSGSGQTLPSRPFQPISDPSASKRVCFYKSGDYKFSGHRLVINARTFKTFDALLDALSNKVPLPFGVRTITTPRGTHLVRALDDLHDGGSYVCSDQKRVKPLNLDEVNRRQVPWNTTRPFSAGRQKRQRLQIGRRNEVTNRSAKVAERVAVRTPKRIVVIKNRDPTVKRTIVLQKRTAPTFDALLDYLSQMLEFPVLKLFTTDGRRVDGLAALILCSGVVVAAGNEPFRLGNNSFHRAGQMAQTAYMDTVEPSMLQPRVRKFKSVLSL
ncbi:Oxygen-regulated protein 1 [Collichthys lucidus]|uniref:Oxygen-regulated protein 1 n=1 Tax=Collichthys lucidus TaxID=240159 RepID=A0A4U5UWG1_COLLU|nr:Oxygen-regulated protein 1 [Collichthys lucidus]